MVKWLERIRTSAQTLFDHGISSRHLLAQAERPVAEAFPFIIDFTRLQAQELADLENMKQSAEKVK